MAKSEEVKYEVVKEIGTISETEKSRMLLRIVKWNNSEPKYDLRSWWTDKEGNEKCSKGITLTKEQLKEFAKIATKEAK